MTCVRQARRDRLAATSPDGKRRRRIVLANKAPKSGESHPIHAGGIHPSAWKTVAMQFVSEPISYPTSRPEKPASTPPTRPDWPAMLTRAELCDYLGVSWSTLKAVLTVRPVDLGASVVRYSRAQIDEWIKTRPPRVKGGDRPLVEVVVVDETVPDERFASLERARQRATRRE
jgi:predicted DNA-binding transcriptional regulator AlpA